MRFSYILPIPLFPVLWMPDSHISDVYLACKRKNIQITLQNVSQAYFPSNSSAHAVPLVLFLIKMYSTPFELFKDWKTWSLSYLERTGMRGKPVVAWNNLAISSPLMVF